jgi:hypothetical protein
VNEHFLVVKVSHCGGGVLLGGGLSNAALPVKRNFACHLFAPFSTSNLKQHRSLDKVIIDVEREDYCYCVL